MSPKAAWTCRFTSLTTLFHYEGPPGNADAVRYVAASGARVFSAGSLQFVWGLDDFRTGAPGKRRIRGSSSSCETRSTT